MVYEEVNGWSDGKNDALGDGWCDLIKTFGLFFLFVFFSFLTPISNLCCSRRVLLPALRESL